MASESEEVLPPCATDNDSAEPLVVVLPPENSTVDTPASTADKKKPAVKRKASQSRQVHCVKTCKQKGVGAGTVQCHLCQTWIHPACIGEVDTDIVGVWSCPTCRTLPIMMGRALERVASLETSVSALSTSNQQLVTLLTEQRKEMAALREDVQKGTHSDMQTP